jgi:hypothetical protein
MFRRGKKSVSIQSNRLAFSALNKSDDLDTTVAAGRPRIEEGFLGYSEDGFVYRDAVCSVPAGIVAWPLSSGQL